LFTDKSNIKPDANLDLNTKYPLLLEFTKKIVKKLNKQFIQFKMNGDKNLWIIKPGHQSRGRGIVIMSNYYEILKYIRESKGRNWVI
jgi:hypothetical protein